MEFGALSLDAAMGGVLAHTLRGDGFVLKKGSRLWAEEIATLRAAGIETVVVARNTSEEMSEDQCAFRIATFARGQNLSADRPFTGRANLRAEQDGILRVDVEAITKGNSVDEALTLATPPDYARLSRNQLAATAKVITYFARADAVDRVATLVHGALSLHPFQAMRTVLIVTETPGQKPTLAIKGAEAIRTRLEALGSPDLTTLTVPHTEAAVRDALMTSGPGDLTLILGGSATSDRRDVAPAAVVAAGGLIERFGMPVDPGNLLALGTFRGKPLVILPGCARSPALNGADWVLERLAARLPVTGDDIAAMGVGGLLKEIPSRPQPREPRG
jgi:molybdenum cofactor cytidylyltransferase